MHFVAQEIINVLLWNAASFLYVEIRVRGVAVC
jgi:hypothetical protein